MEILLVAFQLGLPLPEPVTLSETAATMLAQLKPVQEYVYSEYN
jgi:hypothetical protein